MTRDANAQGPAIGSFVERLLAGPLPWARLRQVQKLLRLANRYGRGRVEAACQRALAFDLLNVHPRSTPQNRPYVDGSKPANGVGGVETSWGLPHAVLRRQAAVGGAGDGEGKVRMRSCVG